MPLFNKKSNKVNHAPPPPYENNNSGTVTTPQHHHHHHHQIQQQQHLQKTVKYQPQDHHYTAPTSPPPAYSSMESQIPRPQLIFHCQLAQGSPTGLITGFASVKELYQKIAECYDFAVDEVSLSVLLFYANFYCLMAHKNVIGDIYDDFYCFEALTNFTIYVLL